MRSVLKHKATFTDYFVRQSAARISSEFLFSEQLFHFKFAMCIINIFFSTPLSYTFIIFPSHVFFFQTYFFLKSLRKCLSAIPSRGKSVPPTHNVRWEGGGPKKHSLRLQKNTNNIIERVHKCLNLFQSIRF